MGVEIIIPGDGNLEGTPSGAGGLGGYIVSETAKRFIQSASTVYEVKNLLIFAGTNVLGTPVSIKLVGSVKDATRPGSCRIFDVTNGLVIAETVDTFNTESDKIIDLGAVSNFPTGEALFEVQLKNSVGSSNGRTQLSFITFVF